MTTDTDDRITKIEQRLQYVEDQLAITQLLASYGPLVDAGRADEAAALWTEDGSYHVERLAMRTPAHIAAMVRSEEHQSYLTGGSVHFLGPAWVQVEGDEATAVCESLMVLHRDGEYRINRGTASHFRLRRTAEGWRISHRESALLDGSPRARALLAP